MSDDLKAKSGEKLLAEYSRLVKPAPYFARIYEQICALESELLRRLEAGDAAQAELKGLREKLEDWQETHRQVMAEACGDGGPLDAHHCTCVPNLRRGVRELTAEVERLRAERDNETEIGDKEAAECERLRAEVEGLRAERDNTNAILQYMHAEVARLCAASGKLIDGEAPDLVTLDNCMGRMARDAASLRAEVDGLRIGIARLCEDSGEALGEEPSDLATLGLCISRLRTHCWAGRCDIEGLVAERDHHRQANEVLRARVANHLAAFETIARVGCYEAPESSCHRHGSDPEEFCAACLAELMLHDRDGEQLESELDRLRERVAELEDAERIAWCLTVGIEQRDSSLGDATWLFRVDGVWHLAVRRDSEVLGHWFTLSHGAYPALSQQARALIDAAREKGGAET